MIDLNEFKFYDIDELAELLKVTRRTAYVYARTGKIKGVKIGKRWTFKAENIKKFIESGSQ